MTSEQALTNEQLELGRALERIASWLRMSRAAAGVSATTLTTLSRLNERGPQRITELAAGEGVSQPAMSTLVDRLEQRGWAARALDASDRRATLVVITTAGTQHITAHRRARAEVVGARIAGLSPDDQSALAAALPALGRLAATAPLGQHAKEEESNVNA